MKNSKTVKWESKFSEDAYNLSQIEIAAKFVATIDKRGWPHITFIAANRAKTPTQVVWGQFTEGTSKQNVLRNPKQGILMMTAEMPFQFIQVKVDFDYLTHEGEDIEKFSRMEFIRYNTYLNIHTVYYNIVKAVTPVRNLSILGILRGILANIIGGGGPKAKDPTTKLPSVAFQLFNAKIGPKFISYVDPTDSYPVIIPCFQLRAPDRSRLAFTLSQFKEDLLHIPPEAPVAAFAMNFETISNHVNGIFTGFQKSRGITYGIIEIEEVYNSMPPLAGVVYPQIQTRPKVTEFSLE
ncbi:MAG: hypothetical protein ACTSRS_07340 [Candidatus Helarchaeota archaeon]